MVRTASPFDVSSLARMRVGLSRLCGKSLFRLIDDRFESSAFIHGQISHNLTVQFDTSQLYAVHELRIGEAFSANRSVDTLNPDSAESPLFNLAIAIGILARFFDSLPSDADRIFAAAIIAFCLIQ